jgi:dephospho-CoA kinase
MKIIVNQNFELLENTRCVMNLFYSSSSIALLLNLILCYSFIFPIQSFVKIIPSITTSTSEHGQISSNNQLNRYFMRFRFATYTKVLYSMMKRRPMHLNALKIGLTGSIGMGKSTVAGHFKDLGFPVFDADATVHELYACGGKAVEPMRSVFPDVIVDGAVSREKLSAKIMKKEIDLTEIEKIVHPLVFNARKEFYEMKCSEGYFLVIFDIPLLFEKPSPHDEVDYIVVASASAAVQRERCLQRPGMTEEKLAVILSKQLPDEEKRQRADYVINTDYKTTSEAKAQVTKVVESIIAAHPSRWQAWKERSVISSKLTGSQLSVQDNVDLIKEQVKLVVFDLDDTLLEAIVPIKRANEELYRWMAEYMPQTAVDVREKLRPVLLR